MVCIPTPSPTKRLWHSDSDHCGDDPLLLPRRLGIDTGLPSNADTVPHCPNAGHAHVCSMDAHHGADRLGNLDRDTGAHADAKTQGDRYANDHTYRNAYPDSYRDRNSGAHVDSNADGDEHSHSHSNHDRDGYTRSHVHWHADGNTDADSHARASHCDADGEGISGPEKDPYSHGNSNQHTTASAFGYAHFGTEEHRDCDQRLAFCAICAVRCVLGCTGHVDPRRIGG